MTVHDGQVLATGTANGEALQEAVHRGEPGHFDGDPVWSVPSGQAAPQGCTGEDLDAAERTGWVAGNGIGEGATCVDSDMPASFWVRVCRTHG